jgi:hypothetical protein
MRHLLHAILAFTFANTIIASASAQGLVQLFGVKLCQTLKEDTNCTESECRGGDR